MGMIIMEVEDIFPTLLQLTTNTLAWNHIHWLRFIDLLSRIPELTLANNGSRTTFWHCQIRMVWDVLILTLSAKCLCMTLSSSRFSWTKLTTLVEPYRSFISLLIWSKWWTLCHYKSHESFINAKRHIATQTSTQNSHIWINIQLLCLTGDCEPVPS